MNDIKILKLLQQLETLGEELGYYSNLMPSTLEHELNSQHDSIFCAAMICGYYSDQDGGEASDELYESIIEAVEEFKEL
mgnify:CR=1 FL=1